MILKGQQNGSPVSYTMTITLCEADDISTSAPVHRLATKKQIKLLQDQETEFLNTGTFKYFTPYNTNVHTWSYFVYLNYSSKTSGTFYFSKLVKQILSCTQIKLRHLPPSPLRTI